jgi:hypothetical protein
MEQHCNPAYDGEHWPLALVTGACARSVCPAQEENCTVDFDDAHTATLGIEQDRLERALARLRERREEIVKLARILALD